jgi:hypothetical protein
MNKISILQISDIHNGHSDKYESLMASLRIDINNYTANGIQKPNIIVVCGDLINGGSGPNSDNEIIEQYKNVGLFLKMLVDEFLEGDKERIIIVPGNHDFNRETSIKSMRMLDSSNPENLYKELKDEDIDVRWNWKDLKFYQIFDSILYNTRFDQFRYFYNTFYDGKRYFTNSPEEQSYLIDLPEYDIAFVGFNSCHNLDHLNNSGCIYPPCLSRLSKDITALHEQGRLIIGVWHHHISGLPSESNYLDKRILLAMVDNHISLGLHGHSHSNDNINEFRNVYTNNNLWLISSGTLYGGRNELPYGSKRQYNIIEIDKDANNILIKVHSREDHSCALFEIPSWSEGNIANTLQSKFDIKLPLIHKPDINHSIDYILKEVEESGDYKFACNKLEALGVDNLIVRSFLLDFMNLTESYEKIAEVFVEPLNSKEAVCVLNAVLEMGDIERMKKIISSEYIKTCDDPSVKELKQKVIYKIQYKSK